MADIIAVVTNCFPASDGSGDVKVQIQVATNAAESYLTTATVNPQQDAATLIEALTERIKESLAEKRGEAVIESMTVNIFGIPSGAQ